MTIPSSWVVMEMESEVDADQVCQILALYFRTSRTIPTLAEHSPNTAKGKPMYRITFPRPWVAQFSEMLRGGFDWKELPWWHTLGEVLAPYSTSAARGGAMHYDPLADIYAANGVSALIRMAWMSVGKRAGVNKEALESADMLGGLVALSELLNAHLRELGWTRL